MPARHEALLSQAHGEKAFVLSVGLQFRSTESAETLIKEWSHAADYCIANEPFLYHYEVSQSDQDPLKYLIFERYRRQHLASSISA